MISISKKFVFSAFIFITLIVVIYISAVSTALAAPTITEVNPVPTPTNNNTPTYVVSYTDIPAGTAGTPDWTGKCDGYFEETPGLVGSGGNTALTATIPMPDDNYNDCTLTITNAAGDVSNTISVTSFVVDTTPPTPTIDQEPSMTDPTNQSPVKFVVDFGEVMDSSTVTISDFVASGGTVSTIGTPFYKKYIAYVAPAGDGVITLDFPAGSATDKAGNSNLAPIIIDNSITYDGTAPIIAEVTPISSPTTDNTPTYTVSYADTYAGTPDWTGKCDGYFEETPGLVGAGGSTALTATTPMPDDNYDDCTLTITDAAGNVSNTINVTPFVIDSDVPSGGGGGGTRFTCHDKEADNYNPNGRENSSLCVYSDHDTSNDGEVIGVSIAQFVNDLFVGSTGDDVTNLQNILTEEGYYTGPITGYFGPFTRAAVIRFQEANAITPAVGYVGPITREVLNRVQRTIKDSNDLTPEQRADLQAQIEKLIALVQKLREQIEKL